MLRNAVSVWLMEIIKFENLRRWWSPWVQAGFLEVRLYNHHSDDFYDCPYSFEVFHVKLLVTWSYTLIDCKTWFYYTYIVRAVRINHSLRYIWARRLELSVIIRIPPLPLKEMRTVLRYGQFVIKWMYGINVMCFWDSFSSWRFPIESWSSIPFLSRWIGNRRKIVELNVRWNLLSDWTSYAVVIVKEFGIKTLFS